MKIGIDIRNIGKGRTGDEAVFFNLVKNLALIDSENLSRGAEGVLQDQYFLFTDIQDESILEKIKNDLGIQNKANFQIVSLKSSNKFSWNAWILPKYLRKNPMDVYHTQYIVPFFVPRKVKIITIIHDISFNFYSKFIKFSDLFFLKILIPWSLKRADKIIAVSKFTKEEIEKYYKIPSEKIEVVYNSISDEFLNKKFSQEELEAVRKKYNLPEKYILYLGTLQPRKNIPAIVRAYAKIKEKVPEIKLVLVGNRNAHNFDQEIDEAIRENNLEEGVIFPGYVDEKDKVAVFKNTWIFAFPSFYEGFGIPIIEAMSQELPVVASQIPPTKEVAGNAAMLCEPGSIDQMADMLYNASIDQNLREKMKNSGLERIRLFSWKDSAEKTMKIYNSFK